MDKVDLEALLPYCLGDQATKLHAVIQCKGNKAQAAKQLGISERVLHAALKAVRQRAAKAGYIPEIGLHHHSPQSVPLTGASVYFKETETTPAHWAKFKVDDAMKAEFLQAMCDAMTDGLPRLAPIPAPKIRAPDLLNLITLTDCHVGMYAWAKEGGAEWDLAIAERTLVSAALAMMDKAPVADTCVIAELGDWNHYDGHHAKTPMHGHMLDAAGRPGQMIEASIRILRRVIDAALQRHKKVVLLVAQGNHDYLSYKWLREHMAAAYEREKRLHIIREESPFYAYQHGAVMLAWHHGHTKKNEGLPLLFATKYPQMWGATEYRVAHTGHQHHVHIKEHSGMTVYQHSTLAAADAHASSNGYFSHRQAEVLTYHREFGYQCGFVVTPKMLQRAA